MKIIPVIELEPIKYAAIGRAFPDNYNEETARIYWRECMQDAGLNLAPVKEGSWFVPISDLDDRSLIIILKRQMNEYHEDGMDFGCLSGGYIIQDQDIWIEPQCCGDLSNIVDWEGAVKYIGDEQHILWIGHPWLLVSGDEDVIKIELTVEYGNLPNPHVFWFERAKLCKHIEKTKADMEVFSQKILYLLKEIDRSLDADTISKTLVFGVSDSDETPIQ